MNLVPHGLTPHQYGGIRTWAKRRDKFGPTGFTPEGLREMTRHLIGQNDRRKKSLHRRRCVRGHRYDDPVKRRCNACARLRYHQEKATAVKAAARARARRALVEAHPDHGGSKSAWAHALRQYEKVTAA